MENLSYALSADKITSASIGFAILKIICIYFISAVAELDFPYNSYKIFMIPYYKH